MGSRITKKKNSKKNKIEDQDRKFHDWYRFVLSYPPHLVDTYLRRFNLGKDAVVFDPFCGTGTTLVESKLQNIKSIGAEASPFAHFVSSVKVEWDIDVLQLSNTIDEIYYRSLKKLEGQNIIDDFPTNPEILNIELKNVSKSKQKLLIKDSISPLPLHKALILLEEIKAFKKEKFYNHLLLAFVKAAVNHFSNLKLVQRLELVKSKMMHQLSGLG